MKHEIEKKEDAINRIRSKNMTDVFGTGIVIGVFVVPLLLLGYERGGELYGSFGGGIGILIVVTLLVLGQLFG